MTTFLSCHRMLPSLIHMTRQFKQSWNILAKYENFLMAQMSIGVREEKIRRHTEIWLTFFHFARQNFPCKIATEGDAQGCGGGGGQRDWKSFRLSLNLRQPYIFLNWFFQFFTICVYNSPTLLEVHPLTHSSRLWAYANV
jgi:hypothetical protein